MFNVKFSLFSGTRELEQKIDEMHDKVLESSLYFKEAFEIYLKEKRSDNYRRLRADVLQLVENIDKVINEFDEVAHKFYIEQPDIPEKYQAKFRKLVNQVCECAENMVICSRAFFRDFATVRDYSRKVYFAEHESDKTWAALKQDVFDSDMELAHKIQLCSLIGEVADVADKAEDCVDAILIFTIKRDI